LPSSLHFFRAIYPADPQSLHSFPTRRSSDLIFVALVEFEPEAASTPLFSHRGIPRFGVNDFSPHTMQRTIAGMCGAQAFFNRNRSEEHTSELQSRENLVCRLLLEKKK